MTNQIIYVTVIILLLILLLLIINRKNEIQNVITEGFETINTIKKYLKNNSSENDFIMENFASGSCTKKDIDRILEEEGLNDIQQSQVRNMITSVSKTTLQDLIAAKSPLLTGPVGPPGPQGQPGTILVSSGRLINKDGSFDNSDNKSNDPKYVVTRTEGTNQNSSLSFMDNSSNFGSFQYWQLDVNNNLINRYDNSCLTMDSSQNNLYMAECSPNNGGQKWTWDSSNRIISSTSSTDKMLKCIGLTEPQSNVLTTNVPGCDPSKGDCNTGTPRRYLAVKDCQVNSINPDELWDFI